MIHTIETLKELHEQRFAAIEKANVLLASEMARRVEVLNHAHELAREKERDFIGGRRSRLLCSGLLMISQCLERKPKPSPAFPRPRAKQREKP